MADPQRYQHVTTGPYTVPDQNGNAASVPVNTVVNTILWDGVAPYTPPANTKLVKGG